MKESTKTSVKQALLVLLEADAGKPTKSAQRLISAALQAKVKHGYHAAFGLLLGGSDEHRTAAELASYGLDCVYCVPDSAPAKLSTAAIAGILCQASTRLEAALVLANSSTCSKDFMPRLAHLLDAAMLSDAAGFTSGERFQRLMYAGTVMAEVELSSAKKVATVRTSAFPPA